MLKKLHQHKIAIANTSWLFSERLLDLAVVTFVNLAVIAHLGPGPYGIFSYIIALSSICSTVAALGIDELIVTEIAKERGHSVKILQAAFITRGVAAIFMMFLMAMLLTLERDREHFESLLWVVIFQPIPVALNLAPLWFRARMRSRDVFMVRTATVTLTTPARLLGIYYDSGIGFFALILVCEAAFSCTLGWLKAYKSGLQELFSKPDFTFVKSLIRRALPLCLAVLSACLYYNFSSIIVYQLLGATDNGIFSASHKIVSMSYAVPTIVSNSLLPLVMSQASDDENGAMRKLKLMLALSFWISVFIAFVFITLAPIFLPFVFGARFSASVLPLQILALTIPLVALGSGGAGWIIHRQGEWLLLIQTLSGLGSALIIGSMLIFSFGVSGAAIGQLISFLVPIILLPFLGRTGREILLIQFAAVFNRPISVEVGKKI